MKTKVIAVSSFLFNALANATSGDFTIADPAKGILAPARKLARRCTPRNGSSRAGRTCDQLFCICRNPHAKVSMAEQVAQSSVASSPIGALPRTPVTNIEQRHGELRSKRSFSSRLKTSILSRNCGVKISNFPIIAALPSCRSGLATLVCPSHLFSLIIFLSI